MTLQTMTDDELLAAIDSQEKRLVFPEFGIALAHEIGQKILEIGKENRFPIAIDVTRNGQCLFHCALEGATADNADWVLRKNRVVQRFGRSSLYMGAFCRASGFVLEDKFLLPKNTYAPHGGAFPVTIKGSGVIGTVTVSGLPQIEDHELVVSVLDKILPV